MISGASMISCRVIWFLLILMPVMVSNTCLSEPPLFHENNGTRWELLEAAANQYTSLPRSQRLEIVHEMSESLKEVSYRDNRLDMIGLILFGPEKGRSFLRVRHEERPVPVDVLGYQYHQCVRTVADLFDKHCGPHSFKGLRHTCSRTNLCYLATNAAIEEAVILTCGRNIIEPVQQHQVPQQQVPYRYLAFGTGFPFMKLSASKDINQDADDNGVARLLNWAMRVLLATAIFLNYVGSPLAMLAAASCLTLSYVIGSIMAPMLWKKTELPWEKFTEGWTKDQVAEWMSSPGFKEWMIKNYHRIIILPDVSQDGDDC